MSVHPEPAELARAIRALDGNGEVVQFDAAGKISYPPVIQTGRAILSDSAEEHARAFIVAHLVKGLGYAPSALRLEEKIRAKTGRGDRDKWCDLTARGPDGNLHYLMEIKAPAQWRAEKADAVEGQLFGLAGFCAPRPAQLVYATVDFDRRGGVCVLCDIMDGGHSHAEWEKAGGRIVGNQLVPNFGRADKRAYARGGGHDLTAEAGEAELTAIRQSLHNVLWGGGGTGDTEVFNFLVRLLLAKIQDEVGTPAGEPYQVQDNADAETVMARADARYREALRRLGRHSPEQLAEEKLIRPDDNITPDKFLYAVNRLERLSLTDISENPGARDLLGNFFEEVMRAGFKQSKGQFFTHLHIIRFLVYAVQLDRLTTDMINGPVPALPAVIDPSAGSGAFLVEAMKAVARAARAGPVRDARQARDFVREKFEGPRAHAWAGDSFAGLELNAHLGRAAQANMILHADGSAAMLIADGLAPFAEYPRDKPLLGARGAVPDYGRPVNEQFDAVLTNPPFAVDFSNRPEARAKMAASFELAGASSQALFLERWFQLLKPRGRLGAVLPNSVFDGRGAAAGRLREFLLRRFNVRAVISLPAEAFYPHTSTKTSLLLAEKKTLEERARAAKCDGAARLLENNGAIFFAAARRLGYDRTVRGETPSPNNDLYRMDERREVALPAEDDSILGQARRKIAWGETPAPAKWRGPAGANLGRLDAECNLWLSGIPEDRRAGFADYFAIVAPAPIPEERLPARFRYCEIGDVSANNSVAPEWVNLDSPCPGDKDEMRLVKKIRDGDVMKARRGQMLAAKVRPYLGKILYVRDDDVYFTKAFITLKAETKAGMKAGAAYALLRGPLLALLTAYSRWGVAYPTIHPDDLRDAVLDRALVDRFLADPGNIRLAAELEKNCDKIAEAQRAIADILERFRQQSA